MPGACAQNPTQEPTSVITRFDVLAVSIAVGESVTYRRQVVAAASCELEFGDDATPDYTFDCAVGSQTRTFTAPGSFPATLTVTTGAQHATKDAPVVRVAEAGAGFSRLSWRPAPSLPFGIAEGQISLGGKLYVFGGFDSDPYRCCRPADRTYAFDPATGVWQSLAPLPLGERYALRRGQPRGFYDRRTRHLLCRRLHLERQEFGAQLRHSRGVALHRRGRFV